MHKIYKAERRIKAAYGAGAVKSITNNGRLCTATTESRTKTTTTAGRQQLM